MDRFGSDKPDLRFGMELKDIGEYVKDSEFKVFAEIVKMVDKLKELMPKDITIFPGKILMI